MNPGYGTSVIVNYGNGQSTNGGPPAISNALTGALRATRIGAPTVTPPRIPIIERVTPKNVNAQKMLATQFARANVTTRVIARNAYNTVAGYVNRVNPTR